MSNDGFSNLKKHEMDLLVDEIDKLLLNHIKWLKSIQKIIICNLPYEKSLNGSSQGCLFGNWYYSVKNTLILNNPEFIELGVLHNQLHNVVDDILNSYSNKQLIQSKEYDYFSHTHDEFIACLNSFIFSLHSTRLQIDTLTGLPNRGLIFQILDKEQSRGIRKKINHSVAMIDIDFFKKINDEYGHQVGDIVLKNLSKLFVNFLRKYDSIGRYGGEEFIFCMPETSLKEAIIICERLRKRIEETEIKISNYSNIKFTCSFGLSEWQSDLSLDEVIKRSDIALYSAKNSGRNKVVVWSK